MLAAARTRGLPSERHPRGSTAFSALIAQPGPLGRISTAALVSPVGDRQVKRPARGLPDVSRDASLLIARYPLLHWRMDVGSPRRTTLLRSTPTPPSPYRCSTVHSLNKFHPCRRTPVDIHRVGVGGRELGVVTDAPISMKYPIEFSPMCGSNHMLIPTPTTAGTGRHRQCHSSHWTVVHGSRHEVRAGKVVSAGEGSAGAGAKHQHLPSGVALDGLGLGETDVTAGNGVAGRSWLSSAASTAGAPTTSWFGPASPAQLLEVLGQLAHDARPGAARAAHPRRARRCSTQVPWPCR